ncbi:MAG: hypothetical protein Q8O66_01415, partial [bacterium]|nr:hypothetical protein [bacterium]
SDTNTGLWSSGADTLNFSTAGSEWMRIASGGNVGIGTTVPGYKFVVANSSPVFTYDLTAQFSSTETSGAANTGGAFGFAAHDGSAGLRTVGVIRGMKENNTVGNYAGYLSFLTRANGSNPAEAMRITSGGNVGIGTATPTYLLTVGAGSLFGVNSSGYALLPAGAVTTPSLSFVSDTNTGLWSSGADTLNFSTGGSEWMRINSSGYVGIGTTAPTAVLHLKAGTIDAGTAPLKFTSGALLTTAEAGGIEFLTDAFYGTITTGAARKTFAFLESPTFTGTVTIPSPFTLGATSVTTTGVQLNYLNGATGTTGTTTTSLVFSTSPVLVTPTIGEATATSIAIGANTLTTAEWAYLDGQNQTVATTSSPTFANITDSGLTITRIPYASTAGLLVDSANLTFDGTTLSTGGIATTGNVLLPLGAVTTPSLSFVSDTNTGLWSSGADTLNFSTAGSEWMRIASDGNVGIGTTSPTVGLELGSTTAGQSQIINATEGAEMAPALEAANWTPTNGWSAGSGSLVKIAGSGTGTITPSGTFAVTAGRIYKVVIVISAASGNLYDSIGGVAGRESLAAGTHTQYITATNTGKIIFTAGATVTGTITSLSVKELTPNTGGLTVNGRLTLMGGIYSSAGVSAIDINSELGTIGLAGAKASTSGYGLSVNGNIVTTSNIYATGFSYQSTSYLYLNEAANTASVRNVANQQTLRVYNTYTDTSNYERLALSGVQGTSLNLTAETAGTGGDNLNIVLTPSGTGYTILNGNVGIGTSTPAYKLSVGSAGYTSTFNVDSSGYALHPLGLVGTPSLTFTSDTNTGLWSSGTDTLNFSTAGAERVRFTSDGNVGIGTTSPATALEIGGTGNIRVGGLTASSAVYTDANKTLTSTIPTTGTLGYWQRNGTNLAPATIGDYVGIGTATPTYLLTVGAGSLFGVNSSGYALLPLGAVGTPSLTFTSDTNTGLWSSGADTLNFSTAGSEWMRIASGGNVGIGDATPAYLLTVGDGDLFGVNSSGYAILPLGSAATPSLTFATENNTGLWSSNGETLNFSTAGAEWMRIASDGNVGIGTTSPATALEIGGTGNIRVGGLTASSAVYTDAN